MSHLVCVLFLRAREEAPADKTSKLTLPFPSLPFPFLPLQVNPLISFQTLNINVTSWNTEKRTAVSWVINGVRTRDQQNVAAPAISCLFQDPQGIIETAWSFYDDNLVTGKQAMRDDPFNASTIVAYVSFFV